MIRLRVIRISPEELTELWRQLEGSLRGRLRRLAGVNGPIDDLLQETFVHVFPRASQLQAEWAAKYIMRTGSNLAIDYLRGLQPDIELPPHLATNITPYDYYQDEERGQFYVREVLPALDRLCANSRQAVDRYLTGRSRVQASQELGIPVNTLRYREDRAIDEIRRDIGYTRTSDYRR